MALSALQLLLLGGLATTGAVVYKKYVAPKVAAEEMGRDLEQLTPEDVQESYEAAEASWQSRLEPERTSSGHLLFKPLDLSERNPLSGFVGVVKEFQKSPYQLDQEAGRKGNYYMKKSDRGKAYADPTVKLPIARLYFFNPKTGRELAAWELKKHAKLWLPDMKDAVENTFVHAFNHACQVNPSYDQWENRFRISGRSPDPVNCNVQYPVTM